MADKDKSPELQYSADPGKPAGKDKQEKEPKKSSLPVLAEFTITVCTIILVIIFFTIVVISVLTGTSLVTFVFRTSISMLVIGGLLVFIARQIIQGMIKAGMIKNDKSDSSKVK
jgi:hypothetical protein